MLNCCPQNGLCYVVRKGLSRPHLNRCMQFFFFLINVSQNFTIHLSTRGSKTSNDLSISFYDIVANARLEGLPLPAMTVLRPRGKKRDVEILTQNGPCQRIGG